MVFAQIIGSLVISVVLTVPQVKSEMTGFWRLDRWHRIDNRRFERLDRKEAKREKREQRKEDK